MSRAPGRVAAIALLAAVSPARAGTLWSDGDGARQLEVRGFYKALASALALSRGLVEGTSELARAYDEAAALSPEAGQLLPRGVALPDAGASTGHLGRLEAKLLLDRFELTAAYQLGVLVASSPAFSGGSSLTGALGGGSSDSRRRLFDFGPTLLERPGLRIDHNLDRLALRVSLPRAEVIVGRQALSWGTGRLWSPTDLLSPFPPAEVDREVRRGIDALRVSVPLAETAQLELVWLPRRVAAHHGGAVRAQANALGYDFSLSAAKYVDDLVFGADLAGNLGPLGVHGELAYTLRLVGLGGEGAASIGERAWRGVLGGDLRVGERWFLTAEYHYDGWGVSDPALYARALAGERIQRGEAFGVGRHYLGAIAAFQASELLSVQLAALVNLTDPGAQLVPSVEHWFEQSVILRAGAFIPIAAGPDPSALRQLAGQDVLERSDAFGRASTLGLRSEYGLLAFGVFGQVGVYFQ